MILSKTIARKTGRKAAASLLALGLTLGGGMVPATMLNAASSEASAAGAGVTLSVGGSRVVNLPGRMSDVVVANPEVADVFVRSNNQIYILAKAPGETTVSAISKTGQTLYTTLVRVGNNLTSVDQMLTLAMPDAAIQVSTMNGMILLTGTIKAPEDAAEAERLTQAFVGKDVTVVSRLRTATPIQVNLQVKIAEVSRNLLHQVGTNVTGLGTGSGSFSGYIGRNTRNFGDFGDFVPGNTDNITRGFTFQQPTDSSTSIGFLAKLFGMDIAGALDLAETTGLATSLAQPNLTSLSGETASFLAGGEYPYAISNGIQGNTIEFKQYGVQLAFTPTVLSDGRISLRVRPTVSSLDFSINSSVPALRSRSVETTVELGSGQAFMIAGLLSNDTANNVDKVPGLGNIPILGSLFKSRNFQRNETELVIVVTPYLVKPVNAADIRLPTDGFRTATEAQGLLEQKSSDGISGARAPGPMVAPGAPSSAPAPSPLASAAPRKGNDKKSGNGAAAPGFSF
ncbi:type II and III secretion system protein family protein [Sphingobium algorifonticola]|uniref:Type II and III secretion system protein family protein n=1 Tax=Sphingobium algorifonticola TaxID=2008318 RepID=A0A437J9X6_9SPHN|nr:type II and III secretion system protein family protein [Sphingobium algorifonticola]RVT42183.1 type II and III secretion system protein family protein [Sphingobium algorifonticola]